MDRSWMYCSRTTPEFARGVDEFSAVAIGCSSMNGLIRCPCCDCNNMRFLANIADVRDHLFRRGFSHNYTRWIWHGEVADDAECSTNPGSHQHDDAGVEDDNEVEIDRIDDMMNGMNDFTESPSMFEDILRASNTPLYPNCATFTELSAVLKLFNLKASYGWTDKSFTELLKVLGKMLPEGNKIPISTYKAKKLICPMCMDYERIHACRNDCVLYRKEYADLKECPKCGMSRYKGGDNELSSSKKRVPAKEIWEEKAKKGEFTPHRTDDPLNRGLARKEHNGRDLGYGSKRTITDVYGSCHNNNNSRADKENDDLKVQRLVRKEIAAALAAALAAYGIIPKESEFQDVDVAAPVVNMPHPKSSCQSGGVAGIPDLQAISPEGNATNESVACLGGQMSQNSKGNESVACVRKAFHSDNALPPKLIQKCKSLKAILDGYDSDDSIAFKLEKSIFCHFEDSEFMLVKEDALEMLNGEWLGTSCIEFFMIALRSQYHDIFGSIGLMCPTTLSSISLESQQRKDESIAYIVHVLKENKSKRFIFCPSFEKHHWVLLVICMGKNEVYSFDSCSATNVANTAFRTLLNRAFMTYTGLESKRKRAELTYIPVKCPQQPGSTECGYYTMCNMLKVILNHRDSDDIVRDFARTSPYTHDEILEAKDIWAKYFVSIVMNS